MLKVAHLQCQRERRILFRDLTFSLGQGSCLQVYGRNGTGKSSLLKILAGLLIPESGEIEWCGRILQYSDFASLDPDYLKDLIYLGHQTGLKMDLTPIENLQWWLGIRGISKKESLHESRQILQSMGFQKWIELSTNRLSAGLQKRLALARLKCHSARLWILDEPLSSLDEESKLWFETLLENHLSKGGLAVVSSHVPLLSIPMMNISLDQS